MSSNRKATLTAVAQHALHVAGTCYRILRLARLGMTEKLRWSWYLITVLVRQCPP